MPRARCSLTRKAEVEYISRSEIIKGKYCNQRRNPFQDMVFEDRFLHKKIMRGILIGYTQFAESLLSRSFGRV